LQLGALSEFFETGNLVEGERHNFHIVQFTHNAQVIEVVAPEVHVLYLRELLALAFLDQEVFRQGFATHLKLTATFKFNL
jgi:hypothetical protein